MASSLNEKFDEDQWIIQMCQIVKEEPDEYNDIPVSIFSVPKTLMVSDPECYVPQQVAIGPYHHWRSELYEMDRRKLASAQRTRKQLQLQSLEFQDLVDQLSGVEVELKIRAHYHRYLDLKGETLAWMMTKDASFLLEFLQVQFHAAKEGKVSSANNAVLRDIVMLENQIPLFLLRKVLEVQYSSLEIEVADNMLMSISMGFCEQLLPFKMMEELPKFQVNDCAHLLDFLYQVIVPKLQGSSETTGIEEGVEIKVAGENDFGKSSHVKQLLHFVWNKLSKLNKAPVRLLKRILFSKPVKVILKLPWTIITHLPGLRLMKAPIEFLCFFIGNKEDQTKEIETSNINKPPLMEEITIPSVIQLSKAGVKFLPTNQGILSISFDDKTATFCLPRISLDVNTEVILRNLVAYEACKASGPLVLARYTELMNGIIDTEEDAKLLREKGIIKNRLKSDKELANLWNGMTKSIKLTKVPFLDKVIEDVNKYYNRRWKVKIVKFIKLYVFGSWQFLTFIAAIMLLLLMTLEAFCSVYSCDRIFRTELPK